MSSSSILLVADELGLIASVKRVLAREGYECVLATNAADAVIAFGHSVPGLILLQPSVESERGNIVLDELRHHPDQALLRVVLLGESIPGYAYQIEPLPIDAEHFAQTISETLRSNSRSDDWTLKEKKQSLPPISVRIDEPEDWRATSPLTEEIEFPKAAAQLRSSQFETSPSRVALEESLFGDLPELEAEVANEIEAQAVASINSSLERSDTPLLARAEQTLVEARENAFKAAADTIETQRAHEDTLAALRRQLAESFAQLELSMNEMSQLKIELRATQEKASVSPLIFDELKKAQSELQAKDLHIAASTREHAQAISNLELEIELEKQARVSERHTTQTQLDADSDLLKKAQAAHEDAQTKLKFDLTLENERQLEIVAQEHRAALGQLQGLLDISRNELADAAAQKSIAQTSTNAELQQLTLKFENELKHLREEAQYRELEFEEKQKAEALAAQVRFDSLEAERAAAFSKQRALSDELESLKRTALEFKSLSDNQEQELQRWREHVSGEGSQHLKEISELQQQLAMREKAAQSVNEAHDRVLKELTEEKQQLVVSLAASHEQIVLVSKAGDESRAAALELESRIDALSRQNEEKNRQLQQHTDSLATQNEAFVLLQQSLVDEKAVSANKQQAHLQQVNDLTSRLSSMQMATGQLAEKISELDQALAASRSSLEAQQEKHQIELAQNANQHAQAFKAFEKEAESRADALRAEIESLAIAVEAAKASSDEELLPLRREHEHLNQEFRSATEQVAELSDAISLTRKNLEDQKKELTALKDALAESTDQKQELALLQHELEAQLEQWQLRAQTAEEKVNALSESIQDNARKSTLSLALPGERMLGVPRSNTVTQEGLAKLITQLVLAQSDIRLDLGVVGGERTLFLKNGLVVGAQTSFETEGLVERARRDGLIDARQERELRQLKAASTKEQLEALQARGFIRENEVVALVQRFTESVTIEAFGEPNTNYRLVDSPPDAHQLWAAVPRTTLPLLAESLRRSLSPDVLLEKLGGIESICVSTDSELDQRALGFSEKERKMLARIDGETSVEDVALGSGLKSETAFRSLVVAHWMGLIELLPAKEKPSTVAPDIDIKRLDAKYEEVQEADYFTILGLARSAGTEEVARAFRRLTEEFHPLRFANHSDIGLQQRARVVQKSLEEAAHALEDDKRRMEYARHLVS
jgi:CheY-like chemotaxis protein